LDAAVIFDLDDTLIDTHGVLLPDALRRVAEAVGVDVARLDARGKRIEEVLAPLGDVDPERRAAAARAWYSPEVPPLKPLPGARALLASLRGRVRLHLVTRGDPARQTRKIERSGLRAFFDEVVIRAIEQPGSKRDDFERLFAGLDRARCAVVGDDDRDELRHAAAMGCVAIDVREVPLAEVEAELARRGVV